MTRDAREIIRVVTNINLANAFPRMVTVDQIHDRSQIGWTGLFRQFVRADAIVMRLPKKSTALIAVLAQIFSRRRGRLIYYDVNIPIVTGPWDRLKRWVYMALVRRADLILTLQADTSLYARLLRLPEDRLRYVGFKSNSWEDAGAVERGRETQDSGEYVLACGRSYRDFATFASAMADIGLPTRILLPSGRFEDEGTIPPFGGLPENITIVEHDGSRSSWLDAIIGARVVVVPLRGDLIQPAGISVYLEAMNLSRPVIVSEGPSSREMLDDPIAGVVPAGDPGALARETLRVWNDDELRMERIENARDYVEKLGGVDRMSKDILAAVLQLFQKRDASASIRPPQVSGRARERR